MCKSGSVIRSGEMSDERGGMGDNERGSQAARSLGHLSSGDGGRCGACLARSRARRPLPLAVRPAMTSERQALGLRMCGRHGLSQASEAFTQPGTYKGGGRGGTAG